MKSKSSLILVFLFCAISNYAQDYEQATNKAWILTENHKQQTQIPGCQIAVMVKGKLVWSESFGYTDLENNIKVTSDTKFRVASVSKPLTAMALGKLIDANKIDIDTNIRTYLPEYPQKKYKITARQLGTSTSGIRHYTSNDVQFNTENYETVLEALKPFKNDALLFEPDIKYLYSSYGWVLLSAVMEKASKTSFFELMQSTWDDLGMNNTTFDFPNKTIDQKSKFYIYNKKQQRKLAPYENRSYMYAGGGYLSTAEDLVQMGNQLINSDFISKETKQLLTKSHLLKDGTPTFYGLGWETGVSRLKTKVIYHTGSLPTSVAHLIVYPEEEVVLAYLANTGDNVFFNAREAQTIAELFIEANKVNNTQSKKLTGSWNIETTSLRNEKTKGILNLSLNTDGFLSGTITFKRSRKIITCPVVVSNIQNNKVHLVAVSPMFIDFYLEVDGNKFKGEWLHDFNVKGIPEQDDYWKPREIIGSKI
jgi:CubicO group peptidase (beta-lactamase class C family)